MSNENSLESLKALVYGLGRSTGIKIVPRHHLGDINEQALSLACDVVNAEKLPLDDECPEMQESRDGLARLVTVGGVATEIADAITRYIDARLKWTGRGAVE